MWLGRFFVEHSLEVAEEATEIFDGKSAILEVDGEVGNILPFGVQGQLERFAGV